MQGNGLVTRVRVDVEGSELGDCEQALDRAFSVIHSALVQALEVDDRYAPALVFPRESHFVEEEFGSKVRGDGAILYGGRRVISFEQPLPEEAPLSLEQVSAGLADVMLTGTLLSDDQRVERMERDARVERIGVLRKENGVWAVTVIEASSIHEHDGATLSKALDGAEAALGLLTPSITLSGLPSGTSVTATMPVHHQGNEG